MEIERPKIVKDEHLKYLDEIQGSGITNMFGASIYVQKSFGIPRREANKILSYWMESFDERHPT